MPAAVVGHADRAVQAEAITVRRPCHSRHAHPQARKSVRGKFKRLRSASFALEVKTSPGATLTQAVRLTR
jgi:hypothetical protein